MRAVTELLLLAQVGSCTCSVKTHEHSFHAISCPYRVMDEAIAEIDRLQASTGEAFRDAVKLACDERMTAAKHELRDAKAEIERLRDENATLKAAVGNAIERAEQAGAEVAEHRDRTTQARKDALAVSQAYVKGCEAAARSMRERAEKTIREGQETFESTPHQAERRFLTPRRHGNQAGLAYAEAINNLPLIEKEPTP